MSKQTAITYYTFVIILVEVKRWVFSVADCVSTFCSVRFKVKTNVIMGSKNLKATNHSHSVVTIGTTRYHKVQLKDCFSFSSTTRCTLNGDTNALYNRDTIILYNGDTTVIYN